jgi:LuxR family quorum-sensing transcriptional regulator LasR
MDMSTPGSFTNFGVITTEAEAHHSLLKESKRLGFDFFIYAAIFRYGQQESSTTILSNYPGEWREKYDQAGYIKIDPVMRHCTTRVIPFVWTETAGASARETAFMEEAASFGLRAGVSFPVHTRNGDVGLVTFANSASTRELDGWGSAAQCMTSQGMLLTAVIHDSMQSIAKPTKNAPSSPLTPRELESLKWVAAGKSSWEISRILGITEHGVLFHLRNIMAKFDVRTRHMAVLKAVACGIL